MIVAVIGTTVFTANVNLGELLIRQAQQSPQGANMTEEQQEAIRQRMNSPAIRVIAYVQAVAFLPLMLAVVSGVYFGLFLLLGSSGGYKQFFTLTAFAFLPMVEASVAGMIVILLLPSSALDLQQMNVLSAATFLDPAESSRVLFALAQSLSLTAIWVVSLMVIGFRNLAPKRTSTLTLSLVVLVPWLVTVALRVGIAAMFQS